MTSRADHNDLSRFDRLFKPHLDSAYNLARWLTGNEADARDVVQESCVRALKALPNFREEAPRAWFLTIVRNQSYATLNKIAGERNRIEWVDFSEWQEPEAVSKREDDPELILIRMQEKGALQNALNRLPAPFREMIVLKDVEAMSYAEMAVIAGIPIGTVMSRLSRGRRMLREILVKSYD
jgi:RNA polymerase sigma factor (sigma-70 family)